MAFLELEQAFNAWKASVSEEVFDSNRYYLIFCDLGARLPRWVP